MPIQTALWTIGATPLPLPIAALSSEQLLEQMIVAAPGIVSNEWMLIGRQEPTGLGGRIDLLAAAPDGSLILIELKRDRTPREVVAQALDYAGWVEKLEPDAIANIYHRFSNGRDLATDFATRFGSPLDEETLNQSHQIVVVASSLDDSTERIVAYLSDRDVPINVLCFQVFTHGAEKILARSWLLDPVKAQVTAAATPSGPRDPWNGESYVSFGHGPERSWEDAVEYGFICGGGGLWYSRTLSVLGPGDRVWVKVPGTGYVGVGEVMGPSEPAATFRVMTPQGERPVLEVARRASYHGELVDDAELCEYFVPVRWLQTVPISRAFDTVGLFGNQNTACKPTTPKWRATVDRLKEQFPKYAEGSRA